MERVLLGELPCFLQARGPDHVSATGAIGEGPGLFEDFAVAKRLQEGIVRLDYGGIEMRLSKGKYEIFHLAPFRPDEGTGARRMTNAARRSRAN
jgi:hypothetical protein